MKRAIFFLLILLIVTNSSWAEQPPFHRGVNLSNWFQSQSAGQIQFTRYTKQDLIDIKNLGCDVIRLPINLHAMTGGSPDYTIDPLLFTLLDPVVDWAEQLNLHLILDNHSVDRSVNTPSDIDEILIPVWTQMATHYKNRSNLIYYEILNEPQGISETAWGVIQQSVIDAIRAVDQDHTIIITPAGGGDHSSLAQMSWYSDDNLIYTFHFYDPFIFTHQGVNWTSPSLKSLAGIPYPYLQYGMPELPEEYEDTWVEDSYWDYNNEANMEVLYNLMADINHFAEQRHVRIFCGEFGVYQPNCDNMFRILWHFLIRMYFETYGIGWTMWEYQGDYGMFEEGSSEFDYGLNTLLARMLGFYVPYQYNYYSIPDETGFEIYHDYLAHNIIESSSLGTGTLNYYSQNSPADGDYCINFTGVNQNEKISLQFSPIKDLANLEAQGYVLDFYVRCDDTTAKFDIRFVDAKTNDPDDQPWSMGYPIDNSVATFNGTWNHIQIPLEDFIEYGSQDGTYPPQGDFDWTAVELFEIVAQYGDLVGTDLYFDNITITKP